MEQSENSVHWMSDLSEDWIEEEPIESASALPILDQSAGSEVHFGSHASRIPVSKGRRSSAAESAHNDNVALSERSINVRTQRTTNSNEIAQKLRGHTLSRTVSNSSTASNQFAGSVIQHKPHSGAIDGLKNGADTPEWKRRLLHGQVAYGEQVDLLTGGGLEGLFKPPGTNYSSPPKPLPSTPDDSDLPMPSSPPPYDRPKRPQISGSTRSHPATGSQRQQRQPRTMKYRMVSSAESDLFSEAELSQSSCFKPGLSTQNETYQPRVDEGDEENSQLMPLDPEGSVSGQHRTASGQSEVRHEGLSPIFVSRYDNTNGDVDYAAMLATSEVNPQRSAGQQIDDIADELLDSFHIDDEESQDMPIDATTETQDFAHNGKFVNTARGGRQVSLQHKAFGSTAIPVMNESSMLPDVSVEAGTPKDEIRIPKARAPNIRPVAVDDSSLFLPSTPQRSPSRHAEAPVRPTTSGGSPLKIFGNHDTYTKGRLLRTLSSIEDNLGGALGGANDFDINLTSQAEMDQAYLAPSSPQKIHIQSPRIGKGDRRHSQFGKGDLDDFKFSQNVPHDSDASSSESWLGAKSIRGNAHSDEFRFQVEPSSLEDTSVQKHSKARSKSNAKAIRTERNASVSSCDGEPTQASHQVDNLATPRKHDNDGQGKRLLRTPNKDPIPKRRRTLHQGDINYPDGEVISTDVQESHHNMQNALSRKRKDARSGEAQQLAQAEVLASRQVLQPRRVNSSEARASRKAPLADVRIVVEPVATLSAEQHDKIARIQAELDGCADDSLGSADVDPTGAMHEDGRKRSVTTQDFLKDAKDVMEALRFKLRGSQLGGLREASPSKEDMDYQDSIQESTAEPFSRPPSREGGPLPRLPLQQQDPAILSHLQKYEDTNDADIALASSMKSLNLVKDLVRDFGDATRIVNETVQRATSRTFLNEPYHSDPPNIQITEPIDESRKRKHSTSSIPMGSDVQFDSRNSNSSGPSTGRTTTSVGSKTSENVKSIAPDTVSHMIPEELAGMIYDREKSIWVKRKSTVTNILPSDDSEEDPFGDIPDLTIDETKEMERVQEVETRKREEARIAGIQQYSRPENPRKPDAVNQTTSHARPQYGFSDTTEPSRATNFTSSVGTAPGTRATSWGTDAQQDIKATKTMTQTTTQETKVVLTNDAGRTIEEVEEEIKITESRTSPKRKARQVTISFSSPIASIIEDSIMSRGGDIEPEDQIRRPRQPSHSQSSAKALFSSQRRPSGRSVGSLKKASRATSAFIARPVSRIEEREEDSVLQNLEGMKSERSVSVVVTPVSSRMVSHDRSIVQTPAHTAEPSALLDLSPLSEFTMHQPEESFAFEVSMLHQTQQRPHQARASDGSRMLSLTVKNLVQSIAEVEASEPFWDNMKVLSLKERRLKSIHMLNQFCGALQELDLSKNEIEHLDGAPSSLRNLTIPHNLISDLTSWSALQNLQYLDVSNNELTSLTAFGDLVHLRSLRADNNNIKSLEGIQKLDGLITLRLRNNNIEALDFTKANLPRLTDLDLKGNQIAEIVNLQRLAALVNLNLEDNEIHDFPQVEERSDFGLKYLKLSGNCISHLDVTSYPNLRVLYLDRNQIETIDGLRSTKYLDSLSLREQHPESTLSNNVIDEAFEVRKLFLSGNLLVNGFDPSTAYLNLQYLELANCGLSKLPEDFSQKLPNLRVLNLNFNALEELEPLSDILRLKVLYLAGNCLRGVHNTVQQLSKLANLSKLDLRNNPLALGYYPPACEKRLSDAEQVEADRNDKKAEPFVMEDGDANRDAAFESRLDLSTAVRRRMYEVMIANECKAVKMLDGLVLKRARVSRRDRVFDAMCAMGLVEVVGAEDPLAGDMSQLGHSVGNASVVDMGASMRELKTAIAKAEQVLEESRWGAEDSFA